MKEDPRRAQPATQQRIRLQTGKHQEIIAIATTRTTTRCSHTQSVSAEWSGQTLDKHPPPSPLAPQTHPPPHPPQPPKHGVTKPQARQDPQQGAV